MVVPKYHGATLLKSLGFPRRDWSLVEMYRDPKSNLHAGLFQTYAKNPRYGERFPVPLCPKLCHFNQFCVKLLMQRPVEVKTDHSAEIKYQDLWYQINAGLGYGEMNSEYEKKKNMKELKYHFLIMAIIIIVAGGVLFGLYTCLN